VVTLENISNGTLTSELSEFFEERRYQNTVQFITPKQSVLEDDDIVSKAARVFGAENLRGKVEDEQGELEPLIRDEYRQLRKELESRYGKWVKWSSTPDGDLRLRRITVDPDIEAVKERIGKDTTYVGEEIVARVKENEGGIRVGSLLNDFLQFRRLPVLLDEGVFYSAVSELQQKGDIVLEGNRANFYVGDLGQYPTEIEDEMTIRHPDNLPESVFREETDDDEDETGDDDSGGGITDWGGDDETDDKTEDDSNGDDETEPTETEHSTETVEVSLEGNSARVLKSTAESRINETTDTATHVRLSYDVGALSKSELIDFIEGLPNGEKIEAKVVIERDADE
jgi:hypothetical protein